jgi:hypothetical protein
VSTARSTELTIRRPVCGPGFASTDMKVRGQAIQIPFMTAACKWI